MQHETQLLCVQSRPPPLCSVQLCDILPHSATIEKGTSSAHGCSSEGSPGAGQMKETPLIRCAHNGHLQAVKLLMARGADINSLDLAHLPA